MEQDQERRLAADKYRAQQKLSISRARRLKVLAEEHKHVKEVEEISLLHTAAEKGTNFAVFEPQMAIQLARAARDTLVAEEKFISTCIAECKAVLHVFCDDLEEVHARVNDANIQVGQVLNILDAWGINAPAFTKPSISSPIDPVPLGHSDDILDSIGLETSSGDLDSFSMDFTSEGDESDGKDLE